MDDNNLLRLNISGTKFLILESKVREWNRPGLLHEFANSNFESRSRIADAYLKETNEFFFQRSPEIFSAILGFLQYGELHLPSNSICQNQYLSELTFWNVRTDEIVCDHCREKLLSFSSCPLSAENQHNFIGFPSILKVSETNETTPIAQNHAGDEEPNPLPHTFETGDQDEEFDEFSRVKFGDKRRQIWDFLEDPRSSKPAKVFSFVSIFFIVLSVMGLILVSMDTFQDGNGEPHIILANMETICIIWFTLEYVARFAVSAKKLKFVRSLMNFFDLLAITPFYLELILKIAGFGVRELKDLKGLLLTMRVMRVLRVARVFKLARYSGNLQSFGQTLKASRKEIILLLMYLSISVLLFSTVMYYFEKDDPKTKFVNIPSAFWWCIVTMTTVGYGDMIPTTIGGKLVASVTTISGVIVLAFPVTMIVTNFSKVYNKKPNLHEQPDSPDTISISRKLRIRSVAIV